MFDVFEKVVQAIRNLHDFVEREFQRVHNLERLIADLLLHFKRDRRPRLKFTVGFSSLHVRGFNMDLITPVGVVTATVAPAKADGSASAASLSNFGFTSSDPSIATVAGDGANGCIVTPVNLNGGSVTITAEALALESDGVTSETIEGELNITYTPVIVTEPPATQLLFTVTSPAQAPATLGARRTVTAASKPDPNTPAGRAALKALNG